MEVRDLPRRAAGDRLTPQIHLTAYEERIGEGPAVGAPMEERIVIIVDASAWSEVKAL